MAGTGSVRHEGRLDLLRLGLAVGLIGPPDVHLPAQGAEKSLEQLSTVQRRLPWDRPHRAVVLGAGPVGILGAMALQVEGFEVSVYSRSANHAEKNQILEAVGIPYIAAETHSTDTGWVEEGVNLGSNSVVRLRRPSVALVWDTPTDSASAGAARFVLGREFSLSGHSDSRRAIGIRGSKRVHRVDSAPRLFRAPLFRSSG